MQAIGRNAKPHNAVAALFYAAASAVFIVIAQSSAIWAGSALNLKPFAPVTVFAAPIFVIVLVLLLRRAPQRVVPPSLLIATGAFGASFFINILPQLSLAFALAGAWGFAGLVPSWRSWWDASLFPALLTALVLPFGVSSETGFGFFLRVFITDSAAQILNAFGVTSLAAHDLLIFENTLARVDAPCSGLKSLFTGTAFFLAASAVMTRRLSAKWLFAYSVFLLLMITGNVARIVILAAIMNSPGAEALAQLFHIPLGIVFFALACVAGIWLLGRVEARQPAVLVGAKDGWSVAAAAAAVLAAVAAAFLFSPAVSGAAARQPVISAPATSAYHPLALTPAEERFYNSHQNTGAKKWRFDHNGLSGSLLIVRSSALTSMHAPEICFEANGLAVRRMQTQIGKGGETIRELFFVEPDLHGLYWMQSRDTITDSFLVRLKRYALQGQNDWVMVTILFNHDLELTEKTTSEFYNDLMQHVDGLLKAERDNRHD